MSSSKIFLSLLFLCLFSFSQSLSTIGGVHASDELLSLQSKIQETIQIGKQNIWKEIQENEPLWNMPPWLGTFFLSQYYFELKAFNITGDFQYKTKFDSNFLKQKLIKEQEADGSWMQLVDLNKKEGSLDATIFNYWFLKDVGVSLEEQTMKKAKKFILDHGGIENCQVMTKFKLAVFGQYQWILLPFVPLFIFKNEFPFYSYLYLKEYVAQWVYPHLTGLGYLRNHKTVFPVSRVCLQELRVSRSNHCEEYYAQNKQLKGFPNTTIDSSVDNLMEQMIKLRGPKGSFGAYTISTLLGLLSFKDYSIRYGQNTDFGAYYKNNLHKSLDYVEEMYFNRRVPYQGSLDDGRYWDTILAAFALLQAGQQPSKLSPTMEHLIEKAVQPNGGIPYGLQFEYAPDIDDTAMLLMLYGKMEKYFPGSTKFGSYSSEIKRTYEWLKSNQNSDGGFPAFDKDKNDNQYKLIKLIFKLTKIDKSAQIFDPSCPDIVGHLLQGMGDAKIKDHEVVTKAINYLFETRNDGMWSARWGINYVYAVGAVLPGLRRIGYNMNQQWVFKVIKRLQEVQQDDGGFGEDSDSYNQNKYVKGATTVSMTAWGLLAYLQVTHIPIPNLQRDIKKAAEYIIRNFEENDKKFFDRSVVGTGHRGVLNLQYPIYAYSFPLVALSRLDKVLKGKDGFQEVDSTLNEAVVELLKQKYKSDDL